MVESKASKRLSKSESDLERLLGRIYDRYQQVDSPEANARRKRDFVFHMTDWQEDLRELASVMAAPIDANEKVAGDAVATFLLHASSHIVAAARLLLDVEPTSFPEC